jgi:Skp family chaperone for outer membrane proteins
MIQRKIDESWLKNCLSDKPKESLAKMKARLMAHADEIDRLNAECHNITARLLDDMRKVDEMDEEEIRILEESHQAAIDELETTNHLLAIENDNLHMWKEAADNSSKEFDSVLGTLSIVVQSGGGVIEIDKKELMSYSQEIPVKWKYHFTEKKGIDKLIIWTERGKDE